MEAKQVLSKRPMEFGTDPEVRHFGPTEKVKRAWKIFAGMIPGL